MLEGRGDNFDGVSTDRLKLELPEEMHLRCVGDRRALPPGVGVTATPPTAKAGVCGGPGLKVEAPEADVTAAGSLIPGQSWCHLKTV
ncbi:hypothetical protein CapIbe_010845 [Capra ibex]